MWHWHFTRFETGGETVLKPIWNVGIWHMHVRCWHWHVRSWHLHAKAVRCWHMACQMSESDRETGLKPGWNRVWMSGVDRAVTMWHQHWCHNVANPYGNRRKNSVETGGNHVRNVRIRHGMLSDVNIRHVKCQHMACQNPSKTGGKSRLKPEENRLQVSKCDNGVRLWHYQMWHYHARMWHPAM